MQMPPMASGKRHHRQQQRRLRKEDRRQHHGRNRGHRIGLEQVGGHAGAVADVVADVVGDRRRVARIVLGDARFDLADEVAADVGALGEDAAAKTREDRDQRRAETERDQRIDHDAVARSKAPALRQEDEVERHAEQGQTRHQHAGDGARLEGELEAAGERLGRRLRGADVGAHRDVHADEAGRARQDCADQEADRDPDAEEVNQQREDDDADDGDGHVLAAQIGLRALGDRGRDLLHAIGARVGTQHRRRRPDGVNNRKRSAEHDHPQSCHGSCLKPLDVSRHRALP